MESKDISSEKNNRNLFESPNKIIRGLVTAVLRLIQCLFVIVAWAFWAVFGTLFWIALVLRGLTAYSASFLYAMFTYQEPKAIEQKLRFVANLWFNGFRNAYASVFGKGIVTPISLKHSQLLLEISWSMFIWSGIFLLFSLKLAERIFPIIAVAVAAASFVVGLFVGTWRGQTILQRLHLTPAKDSKDKEKTSSS